MIAVIFIHAKCVLAIRNIHEVIPLRGLRDRKSISNSSSNSSSLLAWGCPVYALSAFAEKERGRQSEGNTILSLIL